MYHRSLGLIIRWCDVTVNDPIRNIVRMNDNTKEKDYVYASLASTSFSFMKLTQGIIDNKQI